MKSNTTRALLVQAVLTLSLCHGVPALAQSAPSAAAQPVANPAYISPGIAGFIMAWLALR